jgi:hypothetical protein
MSKIEFYGMVERTRDLARDDERFMPRSNW